MTIALIAGTGGLPPCISSRLVAQGRVPIICEMRGFPSCVKGEFTRVPFRIETLGSFLATLKSLGVVDVCMVGAVQRPAVDPGAIDPATAPLVPRLHAAMAQGDDGTLREIIAIFEEHGFRVIGAHQIAPELLPKAGVATKLAPPDLMSDLIAARAALAQMGRDDQGQALLVRAGEVIAQEDARGTEALLQDYENLAIESRQGGPSDPLSAAMDVVSDLFGDAADWLSGTSRDTTGVGAVLYKAPKPEQSLRADMPMIGPDTARQAAKAGLAGIVVPSGGVMVLDLPQVIEILDANAMFLWVTP